MTGSIGPPQVSPDSEGTFETVVIPHLDAAYRLARWLMRNDHDAEDVVQEASLRALRYFRTFTGGNARAWFLRIVRNTCHDWRGRQPQMTDPFDEERHSHASAADPEALVRQSDAARTIERALAHLPPRAREVLMLREIEGLSYRELADVLDMPIGTVMSSLSRARRAFRHVLTGERETRPRGKTADRDQEEDEPVLA
jgi:RNA polymerase sigma-70 factor (ECF subfamily)